MARKVNKEVSRKSIAGLHFWRYFPLLLISFVLSVFTWQAIHCLRRWTSRLDQGDLSHPLFWCLVAGVFVVFLFLRRPSPRRCRKCSKATTEYLEIDLAPRKFLFIPYPRTERIPLCREHLFPEFEAGFTSFSKKMVVFYPDLEDCRGSYVYAYLPLSEVQGRGLGEGVVERAHGAIVGGCTRCAGPGQVAYFDKGRLKRKVEKGPLGIIKWDIPLIESVEGGPEILCRRCTLAHILPSLKQFPDFVNGLDCPSREDGVFITLEI